MLDLFRSDSFGVVPLTVALNNLKFVPGYIGSRGLFGTRSISTTMFVIESKDGVLTLVRPTPRGSPGQTQSRARRAMRALLVPHFEIDDSVMADEVLGVRSFGSETATDTVMDKVTERLGQAKQNLEYTREFSRVGAIKGVVTYSDGSTLDLYREYDIAVPAFIDMNLDATTATGAVRKAAQGIVRTMGANLDGIGFTGVEAITGDAFFDALIMNPEVRATYLNTQAANELRQGYVDASGLSWASFEFGGIRWTNYRGNNGATPFVGTNEAYFYPTGVPDFFLSVYAPADYVETVNTPGLEFYSKQFPMPNDKGISLEVQQNVLNFCTRPGALARAVTS